MKKLFTVALSLSIVGSSYAGSDPTPHSVRPLGQTPIQMQALASPALADRTRIIEGVVEATFGKFLKQQNPHAMTHGVIKPAVAKKNIQKQILAGTAYVVWQGKKYDEAISNSSVPLPADDVPISEGPLKSKLEPGRLHTLEMYLGRLQGTMDDLHEALETVRIVVIPGDPFLGVNHHGKKGFQAGKAGVTRRTLYISEDLWNKIKNDSLAVAGFIAHETFHVLHPDSEEGEARKAAHIVDPRDDFGRISDDLAVHINLWNVNPPASIGYWVSGMFTADEETKRFWGRVGLFVEIPLLMYGLFQIAHSDSPMISYLFGGLTYVLFHLIPAQHDIRGNYISDVKLEVIRSPAFVYIGYVLASLTIMPETGYLLGANAIVLQVPAIFGALLFHLFNDSDLWNDHRRPFRDRLDDHRLHVELSLAYRTDREVARQIAHAPLEAQSELFTEFLKQHRARFEADDWSFDVFRERRWRVYLLHVRDNINRELARYSLALSITEAQTTRDITLELQPIVRPIVTRMMHDQRQLQLWPRTLKTYPVLADAANDVVHIDRVRLTQWLDNLESFLDARYGDPIIKELLTHIPLGNEIGLITHHAAPRQQAQKLQAAHMPLVEAMFTEEAYKLIELERLYGRPQNWVEQSDYIKISRLAQLAHGDPVLAFLAFYKTHQLYLAEGNQSVEPPMDIHVLDSLRWDFQNTDLNTLLSQIASSPSVAHEIRSRAQNRIAELEGRLKKAREHPKSSFMASAAYWWLRPFVTEQAAIRIGRVFVMAELLGMVVFSLQQHSVGWNFSMILVGAVFIGLGHLFPAVIYWMNNQSGRTSLSDVTLKSGGTSLLIFTLYALSPLSWIFVLIAPAAQLAIDFGLFSWMGKETNQLRARVKKFFPNGENFPPALEMKANTWQYHVMATQPTYVNPPQFGVERLDHMPKGSHAIADFEGHTEAVVFQPRPETAHITAGILRHLPASTRKIFLASNEDDARQIQRWIIQLAIASAYVVIAEDPTAFTPWSRDSYLPMVTPSGEIVMAQPVGGGSSITHDRNDTSAPDAIAALTGAKSYQAAVNFESGDVAVGIRPDGTRDVFVSENQVWMNENMKLKEFVVAPGNERLFQAKPEVLPGLFHGSHHDLYLTFGPNGHVAVGDATMAVEELEKLSPAEQRAYTQSVMWTLHAMGFDMDNDFGGLADALYYAPRRSQALNQIAERLSEMGYHVHRVPYVPPARTQGLSLSYNNGYFIDSSTYLMPVYGLPTDAIAQKAFEEMGLTVETADARSAAYLSGFFHCATNRAAIRLNADPTLFQLPPPGEQTPIIKLLSDEKWEAIDPIKIEQTSHLSELPRYQKLTFAGRNRDIAKLLLSPVFKGLANLALQFGRPLIIDVGTGAMPFTTIELAEDLRKVNPRAEIYATELPHVTPLAYVHAPHFLKHFQTAIGLVQYTQKMRGKPVDFCFVVDHDKQVREILVGVQDTDGFHGYTTFALREDVLYLGVQDGKKSDWFAEAIALLNKQTIENLIKEGKSTPISQTDIWVEFNPLQTMLRKHRIQFVQAIYPHIEGLVDAQVITANNVTTHLNDVDRKRFLHQIALSLGEGGVFLEKVQFPAGAGGSPIPFNQIQCFQRTSKGQMELVGSFISDPYDMPITLAESADGKRVNQLIQHRLELVMAAYHHLPTEVLATLEQLDPVVADDFDSDLQVLAHSVRIANDDLYSAVFDLAAQYDRENRPAAIAYYEARRAGMDTVSAARVAQSQLWWREFLPMAALGLFVHPLAGGIVALAFAARHVYLKILVDAKRAARSDIPDSALGRLRFALPLFFQSDNLKMLAKHSALFSLYLAATPLLTGSLLLSGAVALLAVIAHSLFDQRQFSGVSKTSLRTSSRLRIVLASVMSVLATFGLFEVAAEARRRYRTVHVVKRTTRIYSKSSSPTAIPVPVKPKPVYAPPPPLRSMIVYPDIPVTAQTDLGEELPGRYIVNRHNSRWMLVVGLDSFEELEDFPKHLPAAKDQWLKLPAGAMAPEWQPMTAEEILEFKQLGADSPDEDIRLFFRIVYGGDLPDEAPKQPSTKKSGSDVGLLRLWGRAALLIPFIPVVAAAQDMTASVLQVGLSALIFAGPILLTFAAFWYAATRDTATVATRKKEAALAEAKVFIAHRSLRPQMAEALSEFILTKSMAASLRLVWNDLGFLEQREALGYMVEYAGLHNMDFDPNHPSDAKKLSDLRRLIERVALQKPKPLKGTPRSIFDMARSIVKKSKELRMATISVDDKMKAALGLNADILVSKNYGYLTTQDLLKAVEAKLGAQQPNLVFQVTIQGQKQTLNPRDPVGKNDLITIALPAEKVEKVQPQSAAPSMTKPASTQPPIKTNRNQVFMVALILLVISQHLKKRMSQSIRWQRASA